MLKSRTRWRYALALPGLFTACLQHGTAPTGDIASSTAIDPPGGNEGLPVCGDGVCGPDETCQQCFDDCGPCGDPPGDPGGDPPVDPGNINIPGVPDLQPMAVLYEHAHTLGVAPLIAGSPNIDSYLASTRITTRGFPVGALDLQDFMNKLFQGGSWANPAPGQTTSALPTDPSGCQQVHVDANYNPEDLVSFDAGAGLLFPSSLQQGAYVNLGVGSLTPIHVPATQRNSASLSSTLLESRVAPTATVSDVNVQIANMIQSAQARGEFLQSTVYFDVVTASTLQEAASKFKLDAKLFGATIGASLDSTTSEQHNTVFVRFTQSLFSVFQDLRGFTPTAAEFNPGALRVADLEALGNAGELAYDNLPTYTRSVTYGRMLLFSVTSSVSKSDLEAAANAVFGKNSASASTSQKSTISKSEIRVFGYGGPGQPQIDAIKAGNWQDYFSMQNVAPGTLKPLGYEIRRLDDQLATMARATSYTERTCPAVIHNVTVQMSDTFDVGTVSVRPNTSATWRPLLQTSGGFAAMDITSQLAGDSDEIKVSIQGGRANIFDTFHAHVTLTVYIDGIVQLVKAFSCNGCHSQDQAILVRVNKFTGEVALE